jgi:hypothetical protein
MMMKFLLTVLSAVILLAACNNSSGPPRPVVGAQLYINATFTNWSHGTSVRGLFGSGAETADHWKTKFNQNPASKVVASKVGAGGIKYSMTPATFDWAASADKGETYYLRQTFGNLKASLGHRFRASYSVSAETAGVMGGFYVNAWWNNDQRLPVANTVTSIALPVSGCQVYSIEFTMPAGPPAAWKLDDAQGVEATFLLTTDHPAVVDVCAGTLVMIQ